MARPRVLLNCASSLDGKLAGAGGRPLLLSSQEDLVRVHRMRAACDAILVGVGTILADDPSLRVKRVHASGPDPIRVVLDSSGRTPPDARVLNGEARTLLMCAPGTHPPPGAEVVHVPRGPRGLDLAAVLQALWDRGVRDVMVEGGGNVLRSFLEAGLVDAWTLYVAPVLVGEGPSLWPGGPAPAGFGLQVEGVERLGEGALWTFRLATPA